MLKFTSVSLLASVSALVLGMHAAHAQNSVTLPAGENTEPDSSDVGGASEGFLISIDGTPVQGNRRISDLVRRQDIALEKADVRVQFDGLDVRPRLTAVLLDGVPASGGTARVESQMNYPAYVQRGEFRLIDLSKGGRTVSVTPVTPNGTADIAVPSEGKFALVHRVYDQRGRFDETNPISLASNTAVRGAAFAVFDAPEEGIDTAARRRIPVHGGAVTVSGSNVRQGGIVQTLGETVRPDPSGQFVIQRILPAGDRPVAVQVSGAGHNTFVERDISIPRSDWFATGIVDLTYGRTIKSATQVTGDFGRARIAGYAKGRTQSGWTLTGSIDTGETDIADVFKDLDKKDPKNVLLRMAREESYLTYGDDSTIEDGAPTDGKIYLKAEKNGNHLLWGNYNSTVAGGYYLRNERKLYGFQGVYRTGAQTTRGQSRAALEVYAASPDNLPGRESFLGTGGSLYFLQRQDIRVGSETLTVELRDKRSGRIVGTQTLAPGKDYTVNYVQGSITLSAPLSGASGTGQLITDAAGDYDVNLVANYEYTPAATNVDGLSYGGRAEAWLSNNVRLGYTGIVEQTDIADQTAQSIDLRFEHSESTFLDVEYAQTTGPGFGTSTSADGGLIITSQATAGTNAGTGEGWSARAQLDFGDLGAVYPGKLSAYYEHRSAGFSTLDYQARVPEELWGIAIDGALSEALDYRLYYDQIETGAGKQIKEGGVELGYKINERVKLSLGAEYLDQTNPLAAANQNGTRTDVAARVDITQSETLGWYVFGQATVANSGGLIKNDRYGAGLKYRFAENWTVDAELSSGTRGAGGNLMLSYGNGEYDTAYIGYRLDPGREFGGVALNGTDQGQYVVGGKRRLSDDVDIYGENTYDLFGRHKSLTSAYGVDYRATSELTFSSAIELGQIRDTAGDFDRRGLSLGARYASEGGLNAKARLEYRQDRGTLTGTRRDSDLWLFTSDVNYKINDANRVLAKFEYADTNTNGSNILSGDYMDGQLGYALRPTDNDRVNLLFKYRYLYDMVGQEVNGTTLGGPRQESHVVSLDVDYDLNQQWTLGGKLGYRASRSSPNDTAPLAQNDAFLGVLNARYHFTHKWDVLLEGRYLEAHQAGLSEVGVLAAGYRHVNNNVKIGIGYNFGTFSDDLTDLTQDDEGIFINLIAKF